jgi:steroid Delta-isomerase
MPRQEIERTVETYFAAIRSMNVDQWVRTFDEDAVSEDPVGAPPLQGHDELRQFFLGLTDKFHRVGLTEDTIFVAGDGAAVKWTGYGVGKNGREVTFEGIDVFQMNEQGKIVRLRAYWDPTPVMAKLAG